jgi:tyrosine-protein phosphatase SIW14
MPLVVSQNALAFRAAISDRRSRKPQRIIETLSRKFNRFSGNLEEDKLFAGYLETSVIAKLTALVLCLSFLAFPQESGIVQPRPSADLNTSYGKKLRLPGLPNGGRIGEALYRGGQPRADGLEELKKLGITTIVDLREENPEKREWERRQAESLGMHFVSIPVDGWSPPTDKQIAQFLSLFREHPAKKIFVHCRFGDDRTGVFVAAYRMGYNQWTAEQALQEMYFFGFNGIWHPPMKAFIRNFPALLKTSPALAGTLPAIAPSNGSLEPAASPTSQ